jgi:hypothetical protein
MSVIGVSPAVIAFYHVVFQLHTSHPCKFLEKVEPFVVLLYDVVYSTHVIQWFCRCANCGDNFCSYRSISTVTYLWTGLL